MRTRHLEIYDAIIAIEFLENRTRRILDEWEDLDGVAVRANELCIALDQWKRWANGSDVRSADLVDIASALADHHELPGTGQLGESLARWAEAQGVELEARKPPLPSIEMGIDF